MSEANSLDQPEGTAATVPPPPPATPAPKPDVPAWGFWPTVGFGLLIGVVNSIAALLAVLIVLDVTIFQNPDFSFTDYVFSDFTNFNATLVVSVLLSDAVSIGLIFGLIKARHGATIKEYLGLKAIPVKTIAKLVGLTLGLVAVSMFIDTFRDLPEDTGGGSLFEGVWPVFVWLAVVGMAPLFEEIMFRGFMFQGFLRTRLGPALAIILPSVWWGLLHAQYGAFDQSVIMALGVVMAVARLRTGSLYGPIAMHVTWNAVAMIQAGLAG